MIDPDFSKMLANFEGASDLGDIGGLSSDKKFKFPYGPRYKMSESMKKKRISNYKPKTVVDPDVIMLGRDALDKEMNSLYQVKSAGHFQCLICRWEFPRKYPMHRHMMLKHLRINLVACPYCPFEGVEKYTVSTHIKEEHKDQPINIKYIQPDVKARVHEFLSEMVSSSSTIHKQIKSPNSSAALASLSSLSALVEMKREKKEFGSARNDEDDQDQDEEDDGDGDVSKTDSCSTSGSQGLVVAMFGKKAKKKSNAPNTNGDIVIKKEIEDDQYGDGNEAPKSSDRKGEDDDSDDAGDEEKDYDEDDEDDARNYQNNSSTLLQREDSNNSTIDKDDDDDNNEASETSGDLKFAKMESYSPGYSRYTNMSSYAPGSHRSPCGGKPKAVDVITKIKVLKSKEGPITKFYCEKCKFISVHRSNVVRHIYKIHERYQTHTCPVCNYQTLSLMLIQTHMEKEHPGTEYTDETFLIVPPRIKPRSRSILALTKHNNKQRRQYQSQRHSSPLTIPNLNVDPAATFPLDLSMSVKPSSVLDNDRGPKKFACAYCHYETNTQDDIKMHTNEEHPQGDASAKEAPVFFNQLNDKSKACWERSKKAVKRKMKDNPEAGSSQVPKRKKFVFEKGDELIQCGYCDSRETSHGRMQHHMEFEHPGYPIKFKRIPAWRFVCKTCAVKTMATSKMKYHLNRHVNYRPYTCISCKAVFPSPDQCRRHTRSNGKFFFQILSCSLFHFIFKLDKSFL